MPFDAIICDLDGTLIDSLEDLADAMNIVLRRSGFPEHPTDRYRYFIGNGFGPLVRRALPEDRRDPETVRKRVWPPWMWNMQPGESTRTRPYPGVFELLDGCAAAGMKMAILTNKPDGPARDMVSRLMPDIPFARVWGARPEFPKKTRSGRCALHSRTVGGAAGAVHFYGRFGRGHGNRPAIRHVRRGCDVGVSNG